MEKSESMQPRVVLEKAVIAVIIMSLGVFLGFSISTDRISDAAYARCVADGIGEARCQKVIRMGERRR